MVRFNSQLSVEDLQGFSSGRSFLYKSYVASAWLAVVALALTLLLPPNLFYAFMAVLLATAAVLFWLTDKHQRDELHDVRVFKDRQEQIIAQRRQAVARLQSQLEQYDYGAGKAQLAKLVDHFAEFQHLLDKRLKRAELTHARMLALAEQLYLAVVDNLNEAVSSLQSISAINLDYLKAQLAKTGNGSQRQALAARLALFEQTEQRVELLLAENKAAIRRLAAISEKLTHVNMVRISPDIALRDDLHQLDAVTQKLSDL